MNRVVNITQTSGFGSRVKYDVYIGRLSNQQILEGVYNYGNPFTVFKFGRELCIVLYKTWFDFKIIHDREFRQAIHRLKGKTLACYCKPKNCHGDVILNYLSSQIGV